MNRISDILKLLPPPANPTRRIDEVVWKSIEQEIGVLPPPDYRDFCQNYGPGSLGTKDDPHWLIIRSPFSEGPGGFVGGFKSRTKLLAEMKQISPKRVPYPALPERGGLFPFAHDDCGFEYYWLTDGQPENWPVIVLPDLDFKNLEMTFTEFIWGLLNGEAPIPSFREALGDLDAGMFVWTPCK